MKKLIALALTGGAIAVFAFDPQAAFGSYTGCN